MAGTYGNKPKGTVSQSRTEWVKKGSVVNGKKVTQGYLAQKGKPGKRVSGTVQLAGGGTRTYKGGRVAATQMGGGQTSKQKPTPPTMSALERRKQQNAGVAQGTRRVGAKNKIVRQYNAKTGRWESVGDTVSAMKRRKEGGVKSSNTSSSQPSKPTTKPPSTFGGSSVGKGGSTGGQYGGSRATAGGGSHGGRAGGFGPMGTPTQQKIAILKNKIAAARDAARSSAAKAQKDAAARAQAQRDAQALRDLQRQLDALQ